MIRNQNLCVRDRERVRERERGWFVVLRFNATLTAKGISWRSVTHVFPGFLTPVLRQLFFPNTQTTFLTYFFRSERQKYAGKIVCLNRGSNSQPPGHESDTLITEPLERGEREKDMQTNRQSGRKTNKKTEKASH